MMILHGPAGTGKTYALSALLELMGYKIDPNCIYATNWNRLLSKTRGQFGKDGDAWLDYLDAILDNYIFMLDDLGQSSSTDFRKDVALHVIDSRYSSKRPTIITTNLDEREMRQHLGFRVSSRVFSKENIIIDMTNERNWRLNPAEEQNEVNSTVDTSS